MELLKALTAQPPLRHNKKENKMTDIETKVIVDCTTGESSIVPLTPEEIAQREADRIAAEAAEAERLAAEEALAELKASAKAKLVAGEPLTEEEASVLVI
jgi:hypothetical protein